MFTTDEPQPVKQPKQVILEDNGDGSVTVSCDGWNICVLQADGSMLLCSHIGDEDIKTDAKGRIKTVK